MNPNPFAKTREAQETIMNNGQGTTGGLSGMGHM